MAGLFKVHQIDEKYFYEIPDSLLGRDMLLVVRIAKTADGIGYGGENTSNMMVRWEKNKDDIFNADLLGRTYSGYNINLNTPSFK